MNYKLGITTRAKQLRINNYELRLKERCDDAITKT